MPRSVLVALLILACSTTACALPGRGKSAAYVIDGLVVAGGVAALAADCDADGEWLPSECEVNKTFGVALVLGGLIGALVNAAIMPDPPSERPMPGVVMQDLDCQSALGHWRAERDPVRKTEIYESIPAWCRAKVERSGDVDTASSGPPGMRMR